MSDLIRREDVIREFVKNCSIEHVDINNVAIFYETIMKIINSIPSVEPERKKGKWIEDETGYGFWICSECGFASEAFGANILYPFCPNCGAKLDWSDDE